ncbi:MULTISPECIES: hypothetical protein [unclassified Nocardioides]|uniref:hypothetical protein n=1 Tax=unclassified Nocardioides TaxID=2615069 RepID=UPI0009EFB845|nr:MULTISPECIES: hypothetical protein [unclassified Nocardioides]GAW48040.1 uncharacterized protein PD653B2_0351 [Nocardioides sp. PD653-B2]GAW53657.1 uncharacterized protein PD653_1060 [Nocardioides sp. PD653]
MKRTVVAAIALTLAGTLAGCAGDDEPKTKPTPSAPTSSVPTASPTPTADPDAWRARFTPEQLKAYDAALQRFESYESRSEPIYAKGEATKAAQQLFRDYFPSPAWRVRFDELKTYEQYEVKITGTPKVYWSRATKISDTGGSVTIRQCVDWREVKTTQHDKPTKPIASRQVPVLREISLSKPEGYDWLIYALIDTPGAGGKKDKPCDPNS